MSSLEDQLSQHWPGITSLVFHRRVVNRIYYATLESQSVVVRLSDQRPLRAIQAELEWQSYLHERGVRTPRIAFSVAGEFAVEITENEKPVVAAVFERIEGDVLSELKPPTEAISLAWGKTLGRMHALTKAYEVPSAHERGSWKEDEGLAMARRSIGKPGSAGDDDDAFVEAELDRFLNWMSRLPRSRDTYGLVHCDHHAGNFRVQNKEIISFDFDDATHHWFAYDLVIPFNNLEALFPVAPERDRHWKVFLEGYASENTLSKNEFDRLATFRKYRAALMYFWTKTMVAEGLLDGAGLAWAKTNNPKMVERLREP